ncbi:hypothetical protein PAXINDRAFT_18575 [Paxillus involutus ATCC 200175]|uniref:Uncharacterized protein n=1 Tax=Paxillus involutus ATCC 200175 TaxID=664439 RepID=A0A0C9TB58_PAXIN|nr:hypothetical protein PAXINDRAFT_18575 [Paxillus involutus ATCC 200175]
MPVLQSVSDLPAASNVDYFSNLFASAHESQISGSSSAAAYPITAPSFTAPSGHSTFTPLGGTLQPSLLFSLSHRGAPPPPYSYNTIHHPSVPVSFIRELMRVQVISVGQSVAASCALAWKAISWGPAWVDLTLSDEDTLKFCGLGGQRTALSIPGWIEEHPTMIYDNQQIQILSATFNNHVNNLISKVPENLVSHAFLTSRVIAQEMLGMQAFNTYDWLGQAYGPWQDPSAYFYWPANWEANNRFIGPHILHKYIYTMDPTVGTLPASTQPETWMGFLTDCATPLVEMPTFSELARADLQTAAFVCAWEMTSMQSDVIRDVSSTGWQNDRVCEKRLQASWTTATNLEHLFLKVMAGWSTKDPEVRCQLREALMHFIKRVTTRPT